MLILALETATEACSVALAHNDQIDFLFDIAPQQHSKILLPMLESLLTRQNVTLSDCTAIAFGQGPGSFTGLRIAAAVAQGLSLAHHLPLISISSLKSLALAAKNTVPHADYFLAALDARMGEIYYALYSFDDESESTAVIADCLASPEEAANLLNPYFSNNTWVGFGSGVTFLQSYLQSEAMLLLPAAYPCAREIALLAIKDYEDERWTKIDDALPHYLRNKITHQSKKQP